MAWIGIVTEDGRDLIAIASAGEEQGYLAEITPISLNPDIVEGPVMRMLRSSRFVHCNDIATDPLMAPWADKALSRGFRSSIILPIRKSGKIIGSFNLYSDEPDCFDENEISLLVETTNNISYTLDNFGKEEMRQKAEKLIKEEKIFSESIINSLPGVFYFYNDQGKFLKWNRNFEVVTGYTGQEVATMHPLDFFRGDDKVLLQQKIAEVFRTGYADVVADFHTRDGRPLPYYFNGKKVTFKGVDYLIGMGLDITDRVHAEKALRERTEEIEKLSAHLQNIREEERSHIALEIHDVLGQQLTALKMDATWLRKRVSKEKDVEDRVSAMISLIDDTIKTVRRISSELRPGILDDLGLIAALEWQGNEFEKNTGIELTFETNRTDVDLERNFATNIFRIYQEALTNITRHANATTVFTRFSQDNEQIQLVVQDNGDGFDLDEIVNKKSLGMISMKERARLFRGEVRIENNKPRGTIVTLRVPLARNENQPV